jgi:hypothetical protein
VAGEERAWTFGGRSDTVAGLVRGMVSVGAGTVYVYTARLKVVYSILQ